MTLLLITLLGVASIGLVTVDRIIERPSIGISTALVAFVASWTTPTPLAFSAAGIQVFAFDLLVIGFGGAAVAAVLRTGMKTRAQGFGLLLFALLLFSVGRGALQYGVDTAVNESRRLLYFVGPLIYVTAFTWSREEMSRAARHVVYAALALCALAGVRWIGYFAGLPSSGVLFNSGLATGQPLRVIPSSPGLFIVQALMLVVTLQRMHVPIPHVRTVAWVFFTCTLLLQHRTNWVVAIAGFAIMAVRDEQLGRRARMAGIVAALVVCVGLLGATGGGGLSVQEELPDSVTNAQTFEWRLRGWTALFDDQPDEIHEWVMGLPFGGGYERVVFGQLVAATPHNYYIDVLLRTGVVGLLTFLATYAVIRLDAQRTRLPSRLRTLLLMGLASQLVYSITYSLDFDQGILLGLIAAASVLAPADEQRLDVPASRGASSSPVVT